MKRNQNPSTCSQERRNGCGLPRYLDTDKILPYSQTNFDGISRQMTKAPVSDLGSILDSNPTCRLILWVSTHLHMVQDMAQPDHQSTSFQIEIDIVIFLVLWKLKRPKIY